MCARVRVYVRQLKTFAKMLFKQWHCLMLFIVLSVVDVSAKFGKLLVSRSMN